MGLVHSHDYVGGGEAKMNTDIIVCHYGNVKKKTNSSFLLPLWEFFYVCTVSTLFQVSFNVLYSESGKKKSAEWEPYWRNDVQA